MFKKVFMLLGVAFVGMQFFRPKTNESDVQTYHMATKYNIPTEVSNILQKACNDCHSNKTDFTWPVKIQPFGWWMTSHVEDGKKHLNFSEFTSRRAAIQNHKFEEIIEMVESKEMPLPSYTWLGFHSEAKLSEAERQVLIVWAKAQMDTLRAKFPADSLILKRK
jgi:hypothetical protein